MVRVIRFRTVAARLALCAILQGCAPIPLAPPDVLLDEIFGADSGLRAIDARAGFQRIYCDIYETRIPATGEDRSCEATLRAMATESEVVDPVPASDEISESFAILVAPGLGYDCFESLRGIPKRRAARSDIALCGYRRADYRVTFLGSLPGAIRE